MNIASVPWRCGQSCAWVAGGQLEVARGDAGQHGGGVDRGELRMPGERRGDDLAGLGEVRRAGDVGEEAAGRECPDGRVEQLGLQGRELRRRPRAACASAPPGGGAARRGPCRARRAGCGRSARRSVAEARAVADDDLGRGLERPRERSRTSRARAGTSSFATRVAPPSAASAASSAALPPGPAQRSSQRSPGRDRAGPAERERRELRALVLHPRAARGDARGRRRDRRPASAAPTGEYRRRAPRASRRVAQAREARRG